MAGAWMATITWRLGLFKFLDSDDWMASTSLSMFSEFTAQPGRGRSNRSELSEFAGSRMPLESSFDEFLWTRVKTAKGHFRKHFTFQSHFRKQWEACQKNPDNVTKKKQSAGFEPGTKEWKVACLTNSDTGVHQWGGTDRTVRWIARFDSRLGRCPECLILSLWVQNFFRVFLTGMINSLSDP